MDVIKQLKLYRFATVFKYMKESWENSKFVVERQPQVSRISAYFSLLYWFYFYGNDFNDYCTFRFWNLNTKQKKTYISLRRNAKLGRALSTPEIYNLFLDKVKFNNRFADYISRKWIEIGGDDEARVDDFVKCHGTAIYKPRADYGGRGVLKLKKGQPHNCLWGGILEESIENSDSLKRLAPGSLNTVRIVTLIDKDRKLHILAALLRMGNGTAFTDNYHDGGMACTIDMSSGRLKGNAFGMQCKEYVKHPYSGITFDGYQVNGFSECLNILKKIAFEEPEARYVGWDFAITPNGIDLIEGNIPPGEDITQIASGRGLWYEINKLI